MGRNTDGLNRNTPFFVQTYGYVDISANDFDPITTETDWRGDLNISQVGSYRTNGFLARPDADGAFYAVTWDQYNTAMVHPAGQTEAEVIAAIVPQRFDGADNQWIECLLVKVFSSADQTYPTICDNINVGLIL